jgi:hypothetical protein
MALRATGGAVAVALAGAVALGVAARPAHAQAAPPAPATPDDTRAKAEAEAAAAQQAAASLEAQVIELQRSLAAFERERAAFDDVRRKLDEIDARLAEDERRGAAGSETAPSEAGVVRFQDDGFVIRSPDNALLFRPRVRLQALYTGALATAGPSDMIGGVSATPDQSSFSLAHAEVILEGHAVSPMFEYRLQLDAATPQKVEDAFVQWRFTRPVGVRGGQFKVPFGLQNLYWTADLEFVDVSAATAAFSPGWDLGAMVVGRPLAGRLQYQVAIVNGAGANVANDNIDLGYAARIVAAPLGPLPPTEGDVDWHAKPLVSAGLSGFYNLVPTDIQLRDPTQSIDVNRDGRVDSVAIWQGGVEVRAIWRGAAVQGEWFSRLEDPGIAGPSRKFWGAYAQASYFVLPHRLLVGARIGQTDLPLYGATAAARLLAGIRVAEQSAVVGAYLRGNRAKVQVDYTHLATTDAGTAPEEHRVRAAVQLGF